MKKSTALATALFALASFPLLAQQPTPATQPANPPDSPAAQQNPPSTAQAPPSSPAATPEPAAAVDFRPVTVELVSKLDSKTAKTGDNVVVQTTSSVKTANGTEIPKGSKLMGHVIAAQPSAAGANSQVALLFDHVELKGGQSMAVHSQIQSIAPSGGPEPGRPDPASAASANGGAMSAPQTSGSANPGATGANAAARASAAQQGANGDPAAAPTGTGLSAAGTVVATNGNIAIQTTSIPGLLLANNAPGQQDPRMAQASSILLGAKKDIQLDGGTQMVVGVSAAGGQ